MATCRRLLLVLLHSLSTAHALRVAPTRPLSRRTLLAGLATAAAPSAALAVSAASFTEAASATDLAQVLKSYTTLGISLDEWTIETTLMQIGRPTQLQRAVDQLPEETLKRLSSKSSALQEQIALLRKVRQSSLTFLYLASGATKYESQEVGLKYMADVKKQVVEERAQVRAATAHATPPCPTPNYEPLATHY